MRYLLLLAVLIALTQACTKMKLNGQCYSCCGNINIDNNQCTCNGQPCPTCFKQATNLTNKTIIPESKTPYLFIANTSMEQCPEQCIYFPPQVCWRGIVCDSTVYKDNTIGYGGGGYPYMRCDYTHHIFKLSEYKVTLCWDSQCAENTYSLTFHAGCNQPSGMEILNCEGTVGWAAGQRC